MASGIFRRESGAHPATGTPVVDGSEGRDKSVSDPLVHYYFCKYSAPSNVVAALG